MATKKFCVIGRHCGRTPSQSERKFFDNVDDAVSHAKELVRRQINQHSQGATPAVEVYVAEIVKVVGTAQPQVHVREADTLEGDPLFE